MPDAMELEAPQLPANVDAPKASEPEAPPKEAPAAKPVVEAVAAAAEPAPAAETEAAEEAEDKKAMYEGDQVVTGKRSRATVARLVEVEVKAKPAAAAGTGARLDENEAVAALLADPKNKETMLDLHQFVFKQKGKKGTQRKALCEWRGLPPYADAVKDRPRALDRLYKYKMPAVTAMLDLLLVERGARSFPKGAKIGKEQLCERLLDFLEKPDAGLQKKAPKKKAAAEKKAAVDDDEDDDDDEEEVAPRAAAPKRAARGKTSYVVADDDDDDEEEEEEEDESEAGDSDDEAPAAKKRKAAPKKAPKKKPAPKKKKPAPKPAPAAPVFFDEGPDDAPDETFGLDHSAEITLPLAIPLQLFKAVARRILAQNPGLDRKALMTACEAHCNANLACSEFKTVCKALVATADARPSRRAGKKSYAADDADADVEATEEADGASPPKRRKRAAAKKAPVVDDDDEAAAEEEDAAPTGPAAGADVVGRRLRVWWKDDEAWYAGRIAAFADGRHHVEYDDGDEADYELGAERYELLEDEPEDEPEADGEPEAEEVVPAKKSRRAPKPRRAAPADDDEEPAVEVVEEPAAEDESEDAGEEPAAEDAAKEPAGEEPAAAEEPAAEEPAAEEPAAEEPAAEPAAEEPVVDEPVAAPEAVAEEPAKAPAVDAAEAAPVKPAAGAEAAAEDPMDTAA